MSAKQGHLFSMKVQNNKDEREFEEKLTEILHKIEGISHFSIENLYPFGYLQNYEDLFNPTDQALIDQWHVNFQSVNSKMREQLQRSSSKIHHVRNER